MVTVFGWINHLSISPSQPGQLSLLPSVERDMSTSQSEVTFCDPGVKAGLFHLGWTPTTAYNFKELELLLTCVNWNVTFIIEMSNVHYIVGTLLNCIVLHARYPFVGAGSILPTDLHSTSCFFEALKCFLQILSYYLSVKGLHKQICQCTYQLKLRNDKHSTFTFTFKTTLIHV